jgi:hypothetical protein
VSPPRGPGPRAGRELRFDVYGRFEIALVRRGARWVAFRLADGRRLPLPDLVVPPGLPARAIARHLDDLLHELARPGQTVRWLD